MFSQKQMIEKGIEIGHWPTFERYPKEDYKDFRDYYGSIVGIVYDTTGWPVPDDVYHKDNWEHWHIHDPNRPDPAPEHEEVWHQKVMNTIC